VTEAKRKRDASCPCGSGKKYKKCCLLKGSPEASAKPLSQEGQAAFQTMMQTEQARNERFGEVRPVITADFQGHKFVAVGSELYSSKNWKTFPDFLNDYIKIILTPDWGEAELCKPLEERHQIMQWYDALCHFQQKQEKGPDGIYGVTLSGAMRAYFLLSYDLYVLRHHSALQKDVVARLKHKDQFQGARHELFAAATCIRAGFDIVYEDETDSSRKHTEFIATHKVTSQVVAVEAKSRHRPGVLGHPGTPKGSGEVRAAINRLLRDALDKPVSHPYIIFFDLNLPPSPEPLLQKPWFEELHRSVDRVAKRKDKQDCFNLIVFTNQPDHYVECDDPAPQSVVLSALSKNPKTPTAYPKAMVAIHEAAIKYGVIPNTFEEAG